MRRTLALFFSSVFVLIMIAPGCFGGGGSGGSGGSGAEVGAVIVGVTSDLRVGVDIDRLRVQKWIGDRLVEDDVFTTGSRTAPLELPASFPFVDVVGGEVVKVQLDAFRSGAPDTPLVTRIASTRVITNKTLLLRVQLDARCVVGPGSIAPVCNAPETCIAGVCGDSAVDPRRLPAYTPSWSTETNDVCKPAEGGAPIVIVGEGQSDYLPMNDLDVAQVEAGPQGGHHIWIAIRVKNLLQSGSITKVSGKFDDLDLDVRPFQVIFTFDPDEGGYCKLYGMRFQVDQERTIDELLGKVLNVRVEVTDKQGDVGIGERTVTLSQNIL
jgi:hypothetical protein